MPDKKKADERDLNRFAAYYMRWLEDHHVELTPVVEKRKSGGQKVVRWMAGFRVIGGDGWQNVVHKQAAGRTPIEALQNLAAGKYYVSTNPI